MEELPNNHHLDVQKNLVNRGFFNYQPQLVITGFLIHQQ